MSFLFIKLLSSIITLVVKLHIITKNMTSQIKMIENAMQISWLHLFMKKSQLKI